MDYSNLLNQVLERSDRETKAAIRATPGVRARFGTKTRIGLVGAKVGIIVESTVSQPATEFEGVPVVFEKPWVVTQ